MTAVVAAGIVALGIVIALGVGAIVTADRRSGHIRTAPIRARLGQATDSSVQALGRPLTAGIVWFAGVTFTIGCFWGLGVLARKYGDYIDRPMLRWWERGRNVAGWKHFWAVATHIGDQNPMQVVAVVAGVLLAALWWRRRWWVPLLAVPGSYLFWRATSEVLRLVVHRPHPPTDGGTWPSGGCARIVVISGVIVFLFLRWRTASGPKLRTACWSVVPFLAVTEAYARLYNLQHWFLDVIGGLLYGSVMLAVMIAACAVLDRQLPAAVPVGKSGSRSAAIPAAPTAVDRQSTPAS